ncbi:clathrin-coated vesicle protein [Phakopsora pachyrhizi]|uniref:Clathrin-coated vesicle protein n=1 Tax=Phakopsora pachyrhizi TaxID=170000 RepID=A0AAV0AFZ5_PHAPC|nr:clathrin-coated vesicle protein [Phakopsora pachyrhizi]
MGSKSPVESINSGRRGASLRAEPSPSGINLESLDFQSLAIATASDRGEIWLLKWLKGLEKKLDNFMEGSSKSPLVQIEADLIRLVTQPSTTSNPIPRPGRPIRNLIARNLVKIFNANDQRTPFDAVGSLLRVASSEASKNGSDITQYRIASFYVVAEILKAHGSQVMSQFMESVTVALKVIKSNTATPILRYQAILCLNSALLAGAKTLSPSDNIAKDTLKTLKTTLADKTFSIIRGTVECFLTILDNSISLLCSLSDIESHLSICFKGLEAVDYITRRSLSRLIASLLASTQVMGSAAINIVQTSTNSKSKKRDGQDDEEDPYPTTMTAEEKGKTLLSPEEMLLLLSIQYCKPNTSRQAKNGLIDAHATLLTLLGSSWVEQFYPEVLRHVVHHIGCGKSLPSSGSALSVVRHDILVSRKLASILLREVISVRLLSEQGQVSAIKEISSSIINKWPALMPTQQPPSKFSLVLALNEVNGLLKQVGSVTQSIQEVLYNPLIRLLGHPSYSVQIATALCLKTYCLIAPSKLSSTINHVLDLLHKDISHLGHPGGPSDVNKRAIGHAHGLSGLISIISLRPLYVSFDITPKAMSLAIQLLKESGNHELIISVIEIQVAWILVSALSSLGPGFIRLHLPQLLILWKNALPNPTAKETSNLQNRSESEWSFLLHIRECTLSAILSFLKNEGEKLMTLDIARRIANMLKNALSFLAEFEKKYPQTDHDPTIFASSKMSFTHRELLMRRRVFQCFIALSKISLASVESLQVQLLDITVALIADPEKYTGSLVQAAISASTGSFTSVWESVDGFSFGVTSLLTENECLNGNDLSADDPLNGTETGKLISDWQNRDLTEVAVASVLQQPCIESNEHDSLIVCAPQSSEGPMKTHAVTSVAPVATATIDSALELFVLYLPLVNSTQQAILLDKLSKFNQSGKLEKNPGRKMAILVNSVTALLLTTRMCMSSAFAGKTRQWESPIVNQMKDILREALVHPDTRLRSAAAETFGRACALGGNAFMLSQVQHCVTQIVNNTDPESRSGYALAFSQIYTQVGSLSAGAVLKTIVDVLMSLSADPHPSVHFWALKALSEVIHTAGLSYTPFLNSTVGMVVKLYCSESHELESGSISYVNFRAGLPSYQNFCKILNAIIGVLGPELSTSGQSKLLIQLLSEELNEELDEGIKVEALKSLQHFIMFSIESIDLPRLIQTLRKHLSSNRRTLKVASINSIYQLVQKNAPLMSKLGGDQLVVNLFSILDEDPTIEGVRDSIRSWLRQSADSNPAAWIDLCMRIVSRTTTAQAKAVIDVGQTSTFIDEESQGLDFDQASDSRNGEKIRNNSRWRTQLFALQCLHEVFLTVIRNKKLEHFNAQVARSKGFTNFRPLMISRVSDLIKMAFTASTATIMEIRLEGLNVLRDVIENFKRSSDIDFDESPLLEQHQAPIAAALTPAFSHDSFPEVLASAIQVCAVFVGSGVVKEIKKMGRILKLLTSALESCRESEVVSLGEMKEFSTTASIMIKTAVYAAWAEFQVTSIHEAYLNEVITPHLTLLCPLWVTSLREYARLKSEHDLTLATTANSSVIFENDQGDLGREISLPYYEKAWLKMMRATASLINTKNPTMLLALDGTGTSTSNGDDNKSHTKNNNEPRKEPTLHFHVLLGLVYEAAAKTASIGSDDPSSIAAQMIETALFSLEALLQIEVVGTEGLTKDDAIFGEICNLCYRLISTETARVQVLVVRCLMQLAFSCIGTKAVDSDSRAEIRLNQCLRVLVHLLKNAIPGLSSMAASQARKSPTQHASLLVVVFSACTDLADRSTESSREQIYGVLIGLYSELVREETTGMELVGPSLPALKNLVERAFFSNSSNPSLISQKGDSEVIIDVLHGFLAQTLTNAEEALKHLKDNRSSALVKVRKNILVGTLIFTSFPVTAKFSKQALEQYCVFLSNLIFNEETELSGTAIQCAKSLILSKCRSPKILQVVLSQLLPDVIEFIAKAADLKGVEEVADSAKVGILTEALKILGGVISSISSERRPQALAIFLPVYLLFLVEPASKFRQISISQVFQLASFDPNSFKEAMNSLEPEQRNSLEIGLRSSLSQQSGSRVGDNSGLSLGVGGINFRSNGGNSGGGSGGSGKVNGGPSIELKSFG